MISRYRLSDNASVLMIPIKGAQLVDDYGKDDDRLKRANYVPEQERSGSRWFTKRTSDSVSNKAMSGLSHMVDGSGEGVNLPLQ